MGTGASTPKPTPVRNPYTDTEAEKFVTPAPQPKRKRWYG